MATDRSGNPISKQTYFAFGALRTSEGTSPTDYGFTGQRFDASSALMYYGARYYDPLLSRFAEADRIVTGAGNPQNLNRYSYVNNNPVRYTDPSGHRDCNPGVDPECDNPFPGRKPTPDQPPTPEPAEEPKPGICDIDPNDPDCTGAPEAPADECHERACKDDAGPSQPTPTPTTQAEYKPGDPCIGTGCVEQSDYGWFSSEYWCRAIFCNQTGGVFGGSLSLDLPGPFGYTVGAEVVQDTPYGQAQTNEGLFGYNGQSATIGAGAKGVVYLGEAFNYNKGEPSYSEPATSYQLSISVGLVGVAITNTVARPNGTVNGPLAPGVPQTITVGWAPGVLGGFSVTPIQIHLIAGKDF